MADLVEPLYELMADRVRASHVVATDDTIMPMLCAGKTVNARMWVYVGDDGVAWWLRSNHIKLSLPSNG